MPKRKAKAARARVERRLAELQEPKPDGGAASPAEVGAEAARLAKMGLAEVPVAGTSLTLVGLKDEGAAPPTLAQRLEMARRLNEVGPKLPRYVKLINPDLPAKSVTDVINAAKGELRMVKKPGKAKEPEVLAHMFHSTNAGKTQEEVARRHASEAKAERKAAAKGPKKPEPRPAPRAAPKKAAEPKKAGGIGGLVCKLLVARKTPDEILAEVKRQFPKARTSNASIAWYRSKLREEGKLPKA
jgi:hypothetical protein